MKHTNFLSITDYSTDELNHLFELAIDIKKKLKAGIPTPILQGKTLAMIPETVAPHARLLRNRNASARRIRVLPVTG